MCLVNFKMGDLGNWINAGEIEGPMAAALFNRDRNGPSAITCSKKKEAIQNNMCKNSH